MECYGSFTARVNAMFEDLSNKLDGVLKRLRGQGKISESNIADTLREVRRVLLDADVNYQVAKQFIEDVQKKAVGAEADRNLSRRMRPAGV